MTHVSSLPELRFLDLWRSLGAGDGGRRTFEVLRDAYAEPARAYHGSSHIAACLGVLDDPEVRALAAEPHEVEAALWFHDVVYDTRAHDNEEQSARLVETSLGPAGVPPARVARIAAHVRATSRHEPSSPDEALVIDIDLSILGAEPAVYARFEEEIRREYAWVDAPLFAAGRAAVLRRFLGREHVFHTALFRHRLEDRARTNLAAAIRGHAP